MARRLLSFSFFLLFDLRRDLKKQTRSGCREIARLRPNNKKNENEIKYLKIERNVVASVARLAATAEPLCWISSTLFESEF